jgi:hypothetical protein
MVRDHGQDRQGTSMVVERPLAIHCRIEGRAERPQVGRGCRRLAPDALRGREAGSAHNHPGQRQPGISRPGRYAEIRQHSPAIGAYQHIARLHVPVQDARRMSGGERAEQPNPDIRGLVRRQGAVLGQDLLQGPRLHELHHDPRPAVRLDHVEDGDHRRVIQPCRGSGLAQRALVADPRVLRGTRFP